MSVDNIEAWDGTETLTSTQVRELIRTCAYDKHIGNIDGGTCVDPVADGQVVNKRYVDNGYEGILKNIPIVRSTGTERNCLCNIIAQWDSPAPFSSPLNSSNRTYDIVIPIDMSRYREVIVMRISYSCAANFDVMISRGNGEFERIITLPDGSYFTRVTLPELWDCEQATIRFKLVGDTATTLNVQNIELLYPVTVYDRLNAV